MTACFLNKLYYEVVAQNMEGECTSNVKFGMIDIMRIQAESVVRIVWRRAGAKREEKCGSQVIFFTLGLLGLVGIRH